MIIRLVKRAKPNIKVKVRLIKEIGERKEKIPTLEELITFYKIGALQMAAQEFHQVITEFAEFVGMKDKEIAKLIGNLTTLSTTEKTTLVGAINELYQSVRSLSGSAAGINDSATNETSTLSAKKILELVNQAKTDAKSEILGGNVAAELDTIKELADALNGMKTGEDGLNKLIQKISQANEALTTLNQKFTALDGVNLKEAYNRGYNK